MHLYHYLPPAPAEQRAFVLQFLGSLAALALLVVLHLPAVHLPVSAGALWGMAAAVVYLLAGSAWKLEKKAQRATHASIGVAGDGLHLCDERGRETLVPWPELTRCEVQGGRLLLEWPAGHLAVGAREVEDGMELVRNVVRASGRGSSEAPANYIPLDPR